MSSASGFTVQYREQRYLITNWHVASGRRSDNYQPMSRYGNLPTKINIWHPVANSANHITWTSTSESLYDADDKPRWLEHPRFGRRVDAVALPLQVTTGISFFPLPLGDLPPDQALAADVPDSVNIIGFPYGEAAAGKVAIWVQGSIATPMEIDYGELPCFLIDSRTRRGQSGSPVVAYRGPADSAHLANGAIVVGHGVMVRMLGVYSGRINDESDLGKVWKVPALREIIASGVPGNSDLLPPDLSSLEAG